MCAETGHTHTHTLQPIMAELLHLLLDQLNRSTTFVWLHFGGAEPSASTAQLKDLDSWKGTHS